MLPVSYFPLRPPLSSQCVFLQQTPLQLPLTSSVILHCPQDHIQLLHSPLASHLSTPCLPPNIPEFLNGWFLFQKQLHSISELPAFALLLCLANFYASFWVQFRCHVFRISSRSLCPQDLHPLILDKRPCSSPLAACLCPGPNRDCKELKST